MPSSDILTRVFAKLGKEKELLEFRDILAQTLGIVMDFINAEGESLRLSQGRNFGPLCTFLRQHCNCAEMCHRCDLRYSQKAARERKCLVYSCYAGLTDIVVPIFDNNGEYLGCITSGQFRIRRRGQDGGIAAGALRKLERLSTGTDARLPRLKSLYLKCVELAPMQVKGLVRYLQMVGRLLVTTHHNLMFMETLDAPDRITAAKNYIHRHFAEPLTLASVARKVSIAPEYFCRQFHKECGVTFNAYLNYYRMEKAKEYLRDSKLYIAEIARLTGFGSITQFNRLFRRMNCSSPAAWRMEAQAQQSPGANGNSSLS